MADRFFYLNGNGFYSLSELAYKGYETAERFAHGLRYGHFAEVFPFTERLVRKYFKRGVPDWSDRIYKKHAQAMKTWNNNGWYAD